MALCWRSYANGEIAALFSNGDAVREAAIAGLGIAMLPTFIAHEAIRKGELEVVLREHMRPPIGMYAVFPSSQNMPAKMRAFIDFYLLISVMSLFGIAIY
ncbi:hypothetical protein AK51_25570 [Serratia nematodiphila DZ0503SBS1]|nr:hypothetical protein AK51_25570 [Serratia nematodiphila DZ0503SBS1]